MLGQVGGGRGAVALAAVALAERSPVIDHGWFGTLSTDHSRALTSRISLVVASYLYTRMLNPEVGPPRRPDQQVSRRQVAEVINKRIADGTNLPGSRGPGIVELSAEFDIAASTTQKALAHLRDTGEVRTELGLGTFVADSK